jgi:xanthine dehydrogenase YagR molybdenum-binding subunit
MSGAGIDRLDGPAKVIGAAPYVGDLPFDNLAFGALVTSTVAAGRITGIEVKQAQDASGVLAVLTHAGAPRLRLPTTQMQGAQGEGVLPLQSDRVHYQGATVALVVAETLEEALAATALVRVRYASEPAIVELDDDHADVGTPQPDDVRGDLTAGFDAAEVTVETELTIAQEHNNPMEPHASVAVWDDEQHLTLYDSTQWADGVRRVLAEAFGLSQEDVRVIAPFCGGAFGSKTRTWDHQFLAAMAARACGRPVRVEQTRGSMFSQTGHRPELRQQLRLGARRDGTLTAYTHTTRSVTSVVQDYVEPTTGVSGMVYAVDNRLGGQRIVRLNRPTPNIMRAPGESSGMAALEIAMDELAARLGLDPIELRIRNHADVDPSSGRPWSSKSLLACYAEGAKAFGWHDRPPRPRSLRDGDDLVGWGMATAIYPAYGSPAGARVLLRPDGTVRVETSTQEIGTGNYTGLAQLAADALGVDPGRVEMAIGDTALPYAPPTNGSRTLASVGPAVVSAAREARRRLAELATLDPSSPLHAMPIGAVALAGDQIVAQGRRLPLADLLGRHGIEELDGYAETLPRGAQPGDRDKSAGGLSNQIGPVRPTLSTATFGAHFAEVRVSLTTGKPRVSRMVGAFAAGRIVNPKLARNQLVGGMTFGIGMALLEQAQVDRRTGRILNADLAEYHIATHADVPDIQTLLLDEDDPHVNDLGVKGIGEVGNVGSAAAVANAVAHATGVRIRRLPITLDDLLPALS